MRSLIIWRNARSTCRNPWPFTKVLFVSAILGGCAQISIDEPIEALEDQQLEEAQSDSSTGGTGGFRVVPGSRDLMGGASHRGPDAETGGMAEFPASGGTSSESDGAGGTASGGAGSGGTGSGGFASGGTAAGGSNQGGEIDCSSIITFQSGTSSQGIGSTGDRIQRNGMVYACGPYPSWCDQSGHPSGEPAWAPGTGSTWMTVWNLVGTCL